MCMYISWTQLFQDRQNLLASITFPKILHKSHAQIQICQDALIYAIDTPLVF